MPTYEDECAKCGTYDVFESIKAEPLKKCPKCKGKVKRLLGTGAGIIFKGSGFYQTDYRSESYKKAAKADTASASPASTPSADSSKPKQTDSGKAETKK